MTNTIGPQLDASMKEAMKAKDKATLVTVRMVKAAMQSRVNDSKTPLEIDDKLWVEVIAPHRAEAFTACQFLIDEMKETVPIWKRPK